MKKVLVTASLILLFILLYKSGTYTGTKKEDVSVIEQKDEEADIFPEIVLKDIYQKGIIYEKKERFNPSKYVDVKTYNDKANIYFYLIDEERINYQLEGEHLIEIFVRDYKGNISSIRTKMYTLAYKPEDDSTHEKENGHYEVILMEEEYDEIIPAHEERRIIKNAWVEKILIKEGYSETVEYCKEYGRDTFFAYVCSGCGYTSSSLEEIQNHIQSNFEDECGSYSGQNIYQGDTYCKIYDSYELYHEPEYEHIYHEEEAEYVYIPEEVIHHPAKYKKVFVKN